MRSPCDLAGWSFFILIVVATYTAVLTADLTAENLARPYLSTVEDITAAGHTICAQSIFQSFLILRWPTTSFLWLDYPDVGIDELERGDCFALLQSHSWDLYDISATNLASSLCRLGYGIPPGGENALLIPKAYPISSQYQAAFSSLVESLALRHVTPGTYEAAYSSNNCTFAISGEITPQTSLTFELKQMCAPFSILAGCVLIGFVLTERERAVQIAKRSALAGRDTADSVRRQVTRKASIAGSKMLAIRREMVEDGSKGPGRERELGV